MTVVHRAVAREHARRAGIQLSGGAVDELDNHLAEILEHSIREAAAVARELGARRISRAVIQRVLANGQGVSTNEK